MKTTTKQALKAALFEAAFVVLGVALAFAVNEWREDRAASETGVLAKAAFSRDETLGAVRRSADR